MTVFLLQKITNGYVHAVFTTHAAAVRYRDRNVAEADDRLWQIVEREVLS